MIFQTKFYIEDALSTGENRLNELLLYSHAGLGAEFFQGIAPEEVQSGKKLKQVQDMVDRLTKFNVWVEAAVQKTPCGHFLLRDTTVKKI